MIDPSHVAPRTARLTQACLAYWARCGSVLLRPHAGSLWASNALRLGIPMPAWRPPRHQIRATTVLCLRHRGQVAIAGDGQVTIGNTVVKASARKVRKLYHDRVLAGFAGTAADAFTLFARFEGRLEEFRGNLARAAVEMAKDWRADRVLRRLEALLAVADREQSFIISGTGDLIEPDDGLIGIGSGGAYALAAARALIAHADLDAKTIATEAMHIAAGICVYTNDHITVEVL